MRGEPGIPNVKYFGTEKGFNILVMDLLGPSLEGVFNLCNRRFSLKTVLLIAEQTIARVQTLHSYGFLHRDIKPDNFLVGRSNQDKNIYMIDLGLAKRFKDAKTHVHIPYREGKGLIGTIRYASINTHYGIELSRRDDLECISYMLIYFLKGALPW